MEIPAQPRVKTLASVLAAVTAVLAATSSAGTPQSETAAQFPSEATLVTVDAVVLDGNGDPVRGLGQDDFVVTEDGRPQKVTSFEAIEAGAGPAGTDELPPVSTNVAASKEVGRTFAVVFDGVHMTPGGAERAKPATARFLRDGVGEGDSVSLISTADGAWWTVRGARGRDRLLHLLEGLRGGRIDAMPPGVYISDYEAMRIIERDDTIVAGAVWKRLIANGATYDPNKAGAAPAIASPQLPGSVADSSDPGSALREWSRYHPEVQMYASQLYQVVQKRRRVVLETLQRVLESLATRGGRKSLLLVSEGFVADSQTPGFREVIDAARRANTAVYFLDARGLIAGDADLMGQVGQVIGGQAVESALLQQSRFDVDAESDGTDRIADETGGFSVKNSNDLSKGFGRIGRESAAYYLLGYHPTNERRDGAYRKIGVEVSRKGVKVRARKGYFAPRPAAERPVDKGKEKGKDALSPLLQRALDAPFDIGSIPLRVSAFALDPAKAGQVNVVVATDVDTRGLAFERQGDRYVDRLDFMVAILDLDSGKRVPTSEKIDMRLTRKSHDAYARTGYTIPRDYPLASGTYEIRVVVLDENNRKVGSVAHEFEVPEPSGWRVSTPLLSDVLDSPKDGGMPRVLPVARRAFPATGKLYCWFRVYGAAGDKTSGRPEVVSGFSLQTATGQEVLRGDPAAIRPDAAGQLVRVIGMPIEGLAPGDYTLVLTFEDRVAGQRYERREPLTIVGSSGGY